MAFPKDLYYWGLRPQTQGGNGAIESAAVLVNAISRRLDERPQGLSEEALEAAFVEVYERRYNRARDVVKQGEQMQSLTSLEGPFSGLLIRYLVPLFGDALFLKSFLKTSLAGPESTRSTSPRDRTLFSSMMRRSIRQGVIPGCFGVPARLFQGFL
ncbi:FAD binding domain-containing protein [Colletotrichum higginsianum]|nr:FAD binding domain-containing protein [Colletotrichum higginsianum]